MQFNEKTTGTCLHKAIKICLIKAVYSVTTTNTLAWIIFIIILHLHQGYKYINTCAFCAHWCLFIKIIDAFKGTTPNCIEKKCM